MAGEAARPEAEVFRPNATHASAGASSRVAGVLRWLTAGLLRAEAHYRVPVRESRRRLAIVRSRRWGLYGLGSSTFRTFLGRAAVLVFLGIQLRASIK